MLKQQKHHQEILLDIARKNRVRYCDLVAKYADLLDIGISKEAAIDEIQHYYEGESKSD